MNMSIRALRHSSYAQNSATLLLLFASWGIWWSFFQIWLTDDSHGLGLNGSQVGTIYSVNSLVTLIIMVFYGAIQDKLGLKRTLVVVSSVGMTLIAPFVVYIYEPLLRNYYLAGVVVGGLFLSVGYLAAAGLVEAIAERYSRAYGFEYGQARMWGSFGYALVALVAGFLFTVNPHLNFIIGSIFGAICLAVQIFWKPAPKTQVEFDSGTPKVRDMIALLRSKRLWLIIVMVLFTWTFYTVYDQQMFPDFYTGLFDSKENGQRIYGILNSAQVFVEAAMMGAVPILMRRVGVRNTLMLGITVMCLRILGTAIFSDPAAVSAIKMFHALEVPLFILAIFRYLTIHFNVSLSATLYLVGFQVSALIGNVVMSTPLGALRDAAGYQTTFLVISGIVLAAGIFSWFTLQRDDENVQGEPFEPAPTTHTASGKPSGSEYA